jgi:PAS domain-containing protein
MNVNKSVRSKPERGHVERILVDYSKRFLTSEPRAPSECTEDLLIPLIDRSGDGMVLMYPDQTIAWMNRATEDLFGVSRHEVVGMDAVDFASLFIAPNLSNGDIFKENFIVSCFFVENIPVKKYRVVRCQSNPIWVEYSSIVFPDGPNRGARLDSFRVLGDSTRMEAKLRGHEQRYEFLIGIARDLVLSLDPGLAMTSVSPSVRFLLGYEPEELVGKHLSAIMAADSIAEFQKACFLDSIAKGPMGCSASPTTVHTMDVELLTAWDRPLPMEFGFSLVRDNEGTFTGIIGSAHTRSNETPEEYLRTETCSQLERNIEQLACLGDRIRNPLAAIIGLADLEGGAVAQKIVQEALVIDRIVTELDRGYVASLNVRQFLKKHYKIESEPRS